MSESPAVAGGSETWGQNPELLSSRPKVFPLDCPMEALVPPGELEAQSGKTILTP